MVQGQKSHGNLGKNLNEKRNTKITTCKRKTHTHTHTHKIQQIGK